MNEYIKEELTAFNEKYEGLKLIEAKKLLLDFIHDFPKLIIQNLKSLLNNLWKMNFQIQLIPYM